MVMQSLARSGMEKLKAYMQMQPNSGFRCTFRESVMRGDIRYDPNIEYFLSTDSFWYFWGFRVVDLYHRLNPKLGAYDRTESGPCFVVGCGPSLKGFDFDLLKGKEVIVCNRSHEWVPDAKYLVMLDYGTFLENPSFKKSIDRFKRVIFTKTGGSHVRPDAVEFEWPSKTPMVSDSIAEGIHAGHSGQAAVNIAYCLGYNPIYFLGIDCKVDFNDDGLGRPHFYHDPEPLREYIMRPVDGYDLDRMESWRKMFDSQARQYQYRNINVVNLGPDSGLREYPKMDYREVLT